MFIRPEHAELDIGVLQDFIRTYPLGQLTTAIKSDIAPTIQVTHIPWVLEAGEDGAPGVIRAHMARANPQAKVLRQAAANVPDHTLEDEVLVLFNAQVHHYVTPKFYTETKPANGKVVPTWNYAAVQVYGKLKVFAENDAAAGEFLGKQVSALSDMCERAAGYEKPWKVADAPEKYTDLLKKAIIGLELKIDRIEGRFKLSQEMGDGDWAGVVNGFKNLGTTEGDKMAKMVADRGKSRGIAV